MIKKQKVKIPATAFGIISMNPATSKGGMILLDSVAFSKAFQFAEGMKGIETTLELDFPDEIDIDYQGEIHRVKIKVLRQNPIHITKPLPKISVQLKNGDTVEATLQKDKNGRNVYIVGSTTAKRTITQEPKRDTDLDSINFSSFKFT